MSNTNHIKFIDNGFFRVGLCTLALLLIPLVAMQFTQEVNWNKFDFILMGLMLFSFGSLFVVMFRLAPKKRKIIAGILLLAFIYIWAELAVGIFTQLGS